MTNNFKNITIENFSKNSQTYDVYAITQSKISIELLNLLPNNNEQNFTILEIGCGTGILTQILSKKYPNSKIIATDISKKMLNVAKSKNYYHDNIEFKIFDGDNDNIETFNQKIDFCVSSMTAQWIQNFDNLVNNITTLCDFYFTTIGENNFIEWKNCVAQNGHEIKQNTHNINCDIKKQKTFKEKFKTPNDFVRHIIKTGASNDFNNNKLSYSAMKKSLELFNTKYNNEISWDILFCKINKKINQ